MSEPILYKSTNQQSPLVDFKTAMFYPDPPDNGLYVPTRIPRLDDSLIHEFEKMTYPEVVYHVLRPWFTKEDIPDRELENMINKTYTWSLPVEPIGDDYYENLSKGPALAFKCFGSHGNTMFIEYYHRPEKDGILLDILSTSGDTGGSVSKALQHKPNISVFVYFPIDDVTEFQRRQMTTLQDNIYAIGIRGDFDDCQTLREYLLSNEDPELSKYMRTTGNSKSIGRFLPQVSYHFYAAARVKAETGEKIVNEWIPFGNGGNFSSAQYAKFMGAPINILGAISNENDVFPVFMRTGGYEPKKSKKCPSEAMDVGNPSNTQRIVYLDGGRIDRDGVVHKMPNLRSMRNEIRSTSISNEGTREAIKYAYENYGVILDPHGAVAYAGMLEFKGDSEVDKYPNVFLETADPVKFPDLIREELGIEPELPEHMKDIYELEERMWVIEPDKKQARDIVLEIVNSI